MDDIIRCLSKNLTLFFQIVSILEIFLFRKVKTQNWIKVQSHLEDKVDCRLPNEF